MKQDLDGKVMGGLGSNKENTLAPIRLVGIFFHAQAREIKEIN